MTECNSPEMQDHLPDFVSGTLDDVTMSRVSAHVANCRPCTEDLEVLRVVRTARPRVMVPDVSRLVAALPQPSRQGAHGPQLVRTEPRSAAAGMPSTMPPSMQKRQVRGTVFGMSVWRLAATLGVVIAGGTSLLVARRGIVTMPATGEAPVFVDSTTSLASASRFDTAETVAVRRSVGAPSNNVPVSYGDLGDYTEEELQRMLERLDKWDGATSTEPLPGVPIITNSGGSGL